MDKILCSKCKHYEVMLVVNKNLPSEIFRWKLDGVQKVTAMFPIESSDKCYICSKEELFKAEYPLSKSYKRRSNYGS